MSEAAASQVHRQHSLLLAQVFPAVSGALRDNPRTMEGSLPVLAPNQTSRDESLHYRLLQARALEVGPLSPPQGGCGRALLCSRAEVADKPFNLPSVSLSVNEDRHLPYGSHMD